MAQLPLQLFFCQKQIAARFLHPPTQNETIVLTFPGGPGLSGRYLEKFLIDLAGHININIGLIDLPNHGCSILPKSKLPLSYTTCLELLMEAVNELAEKKIKLILFGQSLGARLAFDLLALTQTKIYGAFLTGFPYKFETSQEMQKQLAPLKIQLTGTDPEKHFKSFLCQIIKYYTTLPLSKETSKLLVSETKIYGNECLLDDVPDLKFSLEALSNKACIPYIGILQGNNDIVVPENNFSTLKKLLPTAQFYKIQNCGHFPMLEKPLETIQSFLKFYLLLGKNIVKN